MTKNANFHIDEASSDDGLLYVDIPGCGTVAINVTDEGIIVDIFSADVADESVATCGATWAEITAPDA